MTKKKPYIKIINKIIFIYGFFYLKLVPSHSISNICQASDNIVWVFDFTINTLHRLNSRIDYNQVKER